MIKNFSSAIIILGHGSCDLTGIMEFKRAYQRFESIVDCSFLTYGFLELCNPTIPDALSYVTQFPVNSIILVQSFLLNATHIKNDIPEILKVFSQQQPKYHIKLSKTLSSNPNILELIKSSIETVIQSSKTHISQDNTLVIFVGRGTSDPLANAWTFEVARQLQETMKFGQIAIGFATSVNPKLQNILEQARSSKTQRIIIVPLLLWSGNLYQQIVENTHQEQIQQPHIEWLLTPPLGTHPLLPHIWQELSQLAQ